MPYLSPSQSQFASQSLHFKTLKGLALLLLRIFQDFLMTAGNEVSFVTWMLLIIFLVLKLTVPFFFFF